MNVLFVQFANSMFPRFEVSDGYWDDFYSTYSEFGYNRMVDAFEIPKWIAEVCYFLPKDCERKICWVHHSTDEAVEEINRGKYDFVLFSVMTCTKGFTDDIITRCPSQMFILGGYDSWIHEAEINYTNVISVEDMSSTASRMGLEYSFGTDYSLFEGWTVLPRLTLSYGCMNNCKFCIIPHVMSSVPDDVIMQQVESFKPIRFKLVYIDDKTFGQADNYTILKKLKTEILKYNPEFKGFVVQTTTGMLAAKSRIFKEIGVVVAEIGVETFNNHILAAYRKPSSEKMVMKSMSEALKNGIKVIPNIIVGFPEETEETYGITERFLDENSDSLFGVNFSMYTDYSSPDCVGEVDFAQSDKIELHRKYWKRLNSLASRKILKKTVA